MKRIVCTLCGGTGISYEVPDPVESPKKKPVAAIERQMTLDFSTTEEEEEAWKDLEKRLA